MHLKSDSNAKKFSKIRAMGSYLPAKVLDNAFFEKNLDTSDSWIESRTGIKKRHIAADDELTSDLACKALLSACEKNNIDKQSIDGIILATTTPDLIFPSTAAIVQNKLGILDCFAFDIQAVCSGYVYALSVADSMIKSGLANRIAVIGAETMSRIVDWNDRKTSILFGDGAGAFILDASQEPGILNCYIGSDAKYCDILKVDGGVSKGNLDAKLFMEGRAVFKIAVEKMSRSINEVLKLSDLKITDIDWIVPHQANQRIITAISENLKIDLDKSVSTVSEHGNTSAASIPIAFCKYYDDGKIVRNQKIVFTALGGGITWGAISLIF